MKKGFTLIELLAVIVILAIIALIATPIILGIINDAREQSNQRSVELYAAAIKNAIAKSHFTESPVEPGPLGDTFLSTVEYDGSEVVCTTKTLNTDGTIYLDGCKVNGSEKEYSYGKQGEEVLDKIVYLDLGEDDYVPGPSLNSVINPDDYSQTVPNSSYYLEFKLDGSNKVKEGYACTKFDGESYCLRGWGENYYSTNKSVLKTLQDKGYNCNENSCGYELPYNPIEDPTKYSYDLFVGNGFVYSRHYIESEVISYYRICSLEIDAQDGESNISKCWAQY